MDYNLLIDEAYLGYDPLILAFDPNFQRDIQECARLGVETPSYYNHLLSSWYIHVSLIASTPRQLPGCWLGSHQDPGIPKKNFILGPGGRKPTYATVGKGEIISATLKIYVWYI